MNILTFDIEEWYLEQQQLGRVEKYAEYDAYLDRILAKLDERQFKATFFCVGEMAKSFPQVIRKIQSQGHEIGCHSNVHTWLNKMSESECREDTHRAVDSIEQCIGQKVLSYRAPAFSIGASNRWAFDVLAENGITRDASVFPAQRDFGGFPNFCQQNPTLISYQGITLKEFPIPMIKICGKHIAYSGGGYFRLFPIGIIRKEMLKSNYSMCYFHIGDLLPETGGVMSKESYEAYFKEPGTISARYSRFVKSNLGKKNAMKKMMQLIDTNSFVNIAQSDHVVDWNTVEIVKL